MEKKIKVVWLCHFSNDEIKGLLKPFRDVKEFAPWIPIAIKPLENNALFELYIVAPYPYITHTKRFLLRGVNYTFYNPGIPFIGLAWQKWFKWDYMSNFHGIKRKVALIVDTIHPDVIHLFGAENPYYSAAILPLMKKYPTIVTVQGFCSHAPVIEGWIARRRVSIEKNILSRSQIAFYESKFQAKDIIGFNPQMKLHWYFYGSYEVSVPDPSPQKMYDLVFFARINREKGIMDLLDALKLLKEKYRRINIRLCVIGSAKSDEFKMYAKSLGLDENVYWSGFLSTRADVHKMAIQAKISVLPTYHDINPGTIIESMFLGIPMVSYATDNIPEINEKGSVIALVEKGNIENLAETLDILLDDTAEQKRMSVAARKRAFEMYAPSDSRLIKCLKNGYDDAIHIFNNNHHKV